MPNGLKKTYPVISTCPVCKKDLHVVKLHCHHCDTNVEGNFSLSKFNYLETEKLYFIEVFVKNRGNIKAIEKELNISYPTVKKLLDEVIIGLGYQITDDDEPIKEKEKEEPRVIKIDRTKILDQVEKGILSVNEALDALKKGK